METINFIWYICVKNMTRHFIKPAGLLVSDRSDPIKDRWTKGEMYKFNHVHMVIQDPEELELLKKSN